jgi:glycosyltransferase involved in cell wall biosynthesis
VARPLLIISHPAVLAVNQLPYAALRDHGWDPWLVVPARWRHDHDADELRPEVLPELEGRVRGRRILWPGAVQRHVYASSLRTMIEAVRPDVAFIEAEPTSLAAAQWGRALSRAGIPFGVQADENIERSYPWPARALRRRVEARAAFVAARTPAAASLIAARAAGLAAPLIAHHVPDWRPAAGDRDRPFTVGFAGRLVREKGLDTLADAVAGMPDARLRLVGNGPLLGELAARPEPIEIITGVRHADMPAIYAGLDVLVLPSRTTPSWSEQFGRVLVEALTCGVPVVGSSSGEIPWVVGSTGGGLLFPEGDVAALRERLERLRADPQLRARLAETGRRAALERFSVRRVAADLDRALTTAADA